VSIGEADDEEALQEVQESEWSGTSAGPFPSKVRISR